MEKNRIILLRSVTKMKFDFKMFLIIFIYISPVIKIVGKHVRKY